MVTKLMNRLFSEVDDEFLNDLDEAKRKGILNKVNIQYIRQPDQTIKVNDRENGETTIIKKSGSSIIMKSGDDDALPNSIRSFGLNLNQNLEFNVSELIDLFSDEVLDNTKLFTNFGLKYSPNLTPEDKNKIKEKKDSLKKKITDLKEVIEKNSNKVATGSESDIKHQDIIKERNKLRLQIYENDYKGLSDVESENPNRINDRLSKSAELNSKLNLLNAQDAKIKEGINKENKVSDSNKKSAGLHQYEGTTGEKVLTTHRGRTFSRIDRFFSHAGYENEHTLLIGKLSEIKIAPNEHSKNKLLGDLERLVDQIKDDSITKITKPMLSELKKLKLNDPQYSEIINDLIESVTTDSVTRLFTVNTVTEEGHDIDNADLMRVTREANLGQEVDLNKAMKTVGVVGGLAAASYLGAFNPLIQAGKAGGMALKNLAQGGNWIQAIGRWIPGTAFYKQRQAENQAELNKYTDENGNAINMQAQFKLSPVLSNLKAMNPFSDYHKEFQRLNGGGNAINNLAGTLNEIGNENVDFRRMLHGAAPSKSVRKSYQRPEENNSNYNWESQIDPKSRPTYSAAQHASPMTQKLQSKNKK